MGGLTECIPQVERFTWVDSLRSHTLPIRRETHTPLSACTLTHIYSEPAGPKRPDTNTVSDYNLRYSSPPPPAAPPMQFKVDAGHWKRACSAMMKWHPCGPCCALSTAMVYRFIGLSVYRLGTAGTLSNAQLAVSPT